MKKIIIYLVVCLIAITAYQCHSGDGANLEENSVVATPVFNINFTFYPPKDLDSIATAQQLIEFAWEEFFALNRKSSYAKDSLRDNPDTTWSFSNDKTLYPPLLAWETCAHRSEPRPYSNVMLPPGTDLPDNTGKPIYSPDLRDDSSKLQKLILATRKK